MKKKSTSVRIVSDPCLQSGSSPTPLLLDIPSAAIALSSTIWSVRSLLWAKKIPHIKIGRKFLIDPADLREFIQRLKEAA
jgi:hypothetical protein